ncbi:MAG: hypothetical protein FD120_2771 [Gammaproteobacteria bacterium]|nr:MAG: hypothetical protein FD172_3534 [Methylocystaceae bacterium]TND00579.1 MAG: hypothetical protein FD120_2771 [Gammaproteobacteria bacterium]
MIGHSVDLVDELLDQPVGFGVQRVDPRLRHAATVVLGVAVGGLRRQETRQDLVASLAQILARGLFLGVGQYVVQGEDQPGSRDASRYQFVEQPHGWAEIVNPFPGSSI